MAFWRMQVGSIEGESDEFVKTVNLVTEKGRVQEILPKITILITCIKWTP